MLFADTDVRRNMMKIWCFSRSSRIKSLVTFILALNLSACGQTQEDGQEAVGTNEASVIVKWIAPTTRSNGDPLSLSDIAGYRVYYGLQQGVYTKVDVNDSTAQQVTISDERGFYYFVLTTLDTAGRESEYSPVFQVTI